MLIGKEKQFGILRQPPLHGACGIRRGADYSATLSAEGFYRGCRIYVSDGRDAIAQFSGDTCSHQLLPAILDLSDIGHIGHGTSSVEVGKNHDLAGTRENVSAFGHKVYAAEYDVLAGGSGGFLRKLVGVAPEIGEADDSSRW